MIEDKIKQEYEWQHREIGQPTLDELFSKINEALGIELWIWQKTYMTMGTYRQMGATTAQCLRVLLFSETTPLDYSSPPRTAREDCERQQLREIYQKLNEAGIQTRKARAQQSLPCAGISVEQITQAMETFTEAVFTAAGNICDALAQMFGRQAQAFNAVAEQYKDDKAGAVHGK